jgi:DNA-binding transcriptional ArsR family regulator
MTNVTQEPAYSPAIDQVIQWVLEDILDHNQQPSADIIAMVEPGSEASNIISSLSSILRDSDEAGLRHAFMGLCKKHPWLGELKTKLVPPRPGTEGEQKTGGTKERQYQLQPLSYFKGRPKREWGVDQIIFDRGSSIFVGASGSGKSTFVLDMFLSRACEVAFINRLTKPAFLVWIAGESADELYPRVAAFLACHKIPEEQLKNFLALDDRMPFNNVAEVQIFIEEVREQLVLIGVTPETHSIVFVFDTYAKCTPGADENSTQETKIITSSIDEIGKTFNAHISIIHHMNAQGKIRGSTAFKSSVDTVWNVSKEGDIMSLHCDKMRGVREPEDFTVEVRNIILDQDNIGDPDSSAPVIYPSNAKSDNFTPLAHLQMLRILSAKSQLASGEWQKLCEEGHNISRPTFHRHLKLLVANDLVNAPAEEEKELGRKVYYSLSPKGVLLLG